MRTEPYQEEIKERTYDLKSRAGAYDSDFHPASVPLKVRLQRRVKSSILADTVATAAFQGADVDWYIKAVGYYLKKCAAMNPQSPKKDHPAEK